MVDYFSKFAFAKTSQNYNIFFNKIIPKCS